MTWTKKEDTKGKTVQSDRSKVYFFEEVQSFMYLEVEFSSKLNIDTEIQSRLLKGYINLWIRIQRQEQNSKYTKILRPLILFGSEIWTMDKSIQRIFVVEEVPAKNLRRKNCIGKNLKGITRTILRTSHTD